MTNKQINFFSAKFKAKQNKMRVNSKYPNQKIDGIKLSEKISLTLASI